MNYIDDDLIYDGIFASTKTVERAECVMSTRNVVNLISIVCVRPKPHAGFLVQRELI